VAGMFEDIAAVPIEGPQPQRSLYALTPAAGVRESALEFLAALRQDGDRP
jgi:hypothetical protein